MRTRLRICLKKARYRSAPEALVAARDAGLPLYPYHCDRCDRFHLTSRSKGKWQPRGAG